MSTFKPLSHIRGGEGAPQHAEADRVGKPPLVRDGAADPRSKSSSFIPNVEYMK
jgi:hypothetical protein